MNVLKLLLISSISKPKRYVSEVIVTIMLVVGASSPLVPPTGAGSPYYKRATGAGSLYYKRATGAGSPYYKRLVGPMIHL
ncbi:MAG: hypothetical protein ACPGWR_15845 [Ardenticatenaceae bacterium]